MEKSYGGKAGVWLIQKRKRTQFTSINDSSTFSSTQLQSKYNIPQPNFISKPYDRAKMLKLKGSHHGGIIPKKFLLHSDLYYHNHYWNNDYMRHENEYENKSQLPTSSSSSNQSSQINYVNRRQSPKVQKIGWDPDKCRPIFYFKIPPIDNNMYDENLHTINDHRLEEYNMESNVNQVNEDEEQKEDPDEIWREIMQQMSDKAKQSANKRAYGGSKGKTRRGYTHKALSVLERLSSPKNPSSVSNPSHPIQNKNHGRSRTYSNNTRMTGRLNKKQKLSNYVTSTVVGEENDLHMHQQSIPSISSHIGVSQFETSLTTPVAQRASKTICSALDSDVSNAGNTSAISLSKADKARGSKQNQAEPLCDLQFPDDLDREIPSQSKEYSNEKSKGKKRNVKLMPKVACKKSKQFNSRDKCNNVKECNKENIDPHKVKQISSSTSLSAAKAFFENLDRYELTIVKK